MSIRVSVVGGGSWGTTMAHLCAHNTPTVLYCRSGNTANAINTHSENRRYLPGRALHGDLRATTDIADAIRHADLVLMAVPSHGFRSSCALLKDHIRPGVAVVSLTKGLEPLTNNRMTQVVTSELGDRPVGVLSGPTLAGEIMAGHATAAVLAMSEPAAIAATQQVMTLSQFRVYAGTDVVGVEMAGATKNVIALAAGMAEGLGAGNNTRAALITRGLVEMSRLGTALGGRQSTFSGLAGMGDLVATCASEQSRNRHVGERLGRGEAIGAIVDSMDQIAEGVKSTPIVVDLARSLGVEMPIAEQVRAVITENRSAAEAYQALLNRPPTTEVRSGLGTASR